MIMPLEARVVMSNVCVGGTTQGLTLFFGAYCVRNLSRSFSLSLRRDVLSAV